MEDAARKLWTDDRPDAGRPARRSSDAAGASAERTRRLHVVEPATRRRSQAERGLERPGSEPRLDPRGAERRTIRISGQAPAPRRRPEVVVDRFAGRPDRPARWAFALGIFMVLMAILTGDPGA